MSSGALWVSRTSYGRLLNHNDHVPTGRTLETVLDSRCHVVGHGVFGGWGYPSGSQIAFVFASISKRSDNSKSGSSVERAACVSYAFRNRNERLRPGEIAWLGTTGELLCVFVVAPILPLAVIAGLGTLVCIVCAVASVFLWIAIILSSDSMRWTENAGCLAFCGLNSFAALAFQMLF